VRRNRAPGAGNTRELRVMDVLAEEGWLCASRRHIGGAGDVLAIRENSFQCLSAEVDTVHDITEARLIEVKSTTRSPWVTFGPKDRQELVDTAIRFGAEPWLAWWPPRGKLRWIGETEFPPQPKVEV
jgi:Holliday junction resolvase